MAKEVLTAQIAKLIKDNGDDAISLMADALKATGKWTVKPASSSVSVGFYMADDFDTYSSVVRVAKVFDIANTKAIRLMLGFDKTPRRQGASVVRDGNRQPKYLNMTVVMSGVEEKRMKDAIEAVVAGVPEEYRSLVKEPTTAQYLANRADLFRKSPVWYEVVTAGRKALGLPEEDESK